MNADSETMASVLRRLRRAQGQIGGVIKMTGLERCLIDGNGTAGADRERLERLFLSLA